MATGFGPTGAGPTGAWQTNLLWTGANSWPVGSNPVGSLPQYIYYGGGPVPPGQTLLAGQIAPTRQAPINLPALAPRIPGPLTDITRPPNFQRYYDWKRGEAIKAQWDVYEPMPWTIPGAVLFRAVNSTRYRDWNRANAQTWVTTVPALLAVRARPVLFVVT